MQRCLVALALVATAGCSPPPTAAIPRHGGPLAALEGAQWLWVSSACLDGGLELERTGFARTLRTEARGASLRFIYDTSMVVPSCNSTEVWTLTPTAAGEWRFVPDAFVTQPAGSPCGPPVGLERGVLRLRDEVLEEIRFRSSYCRGFDARFVYRRVPPEPADVDGLVRRFAAHWNRRDADAVAAMFAEDGVMLESLSQSDTGTPTPHRGRENIRAWLARAFATTPWLALELTDLQRPAGADAQGRVTASFRYMDARLAEPLSGRYLMVFAGQELFSLELQFLSRPIPR